MKVCQSLASIGMYEELVKPHNRHSHFLTLRADDTSLNTADRYVIESNRCSELFAPF